MSADDRPGAGRYATRTRFDGRGYLVLGAGQGMGRATAIALAELGGQVYCVDRDIDLADAVAAEIGGYSGGADVTTRVDLQRVVDDAATRLDDLRGVVDVVGMATWSPLLEMDEPTWDGQHDIVLRHAYLTVQIVGRKLVELGRNGAIAFVSSASGIGGANGHAAYGAAKAGLINLVKSAGVELAPHGIRVNAVAPGIVLTDRLAGTLFQDPEYRAGQLANVPMGRLGTAEDIAGALVFLLSDLAAYVTGTTLQVDGGVAGKFGYVIPG